MDNLCQTFGDGDQLFLLEKSKWNQYICCRNRLLFWKRCSISNLCCERYPKNSDIYCNTHRQTLPKNSFCSEDKLEGKTGGEISRAKKKSNAVGLTDLSNFSFHCSISLTKSVKMHGYEAGQYIKPAGRQLQWQASVMDILVQPLRGKEGGSQRYGIQMKANFEFSGTTTRAVV